MKFSFIRILFFIYIFLSSKVLLADSSPRDLVTIYSPAQNYTSLINNGRAKAAIESVLASQSLLLLYYDKMDICMSCPTNAYLLDLQNFLHQQSHKELQALAVALKNYILSDPKLKIDRVEDLKILGSILTDFELDFVPSPHSGRLIANSTYFGVTKLLLAKLLTNLEKNNIYDAAEANSDSESDNSYLQHSLIVRNLARLLVFKSSIPENNIANLTETEVSEALEYWSVLGRQIILFIEPILAIKPPSISLEARDEIVELKETVTKYTSSLGLLQSNLKSLIEAPTNGIRARESLQSLLQVIKSIANDSHQSSILIDARIIIAEISCDTSLGLSH